MELKPKCSHIPRSKYENITYFLCLLNKLRLTFRARNTDLAFTFRNTQLCFAVRADEIFMRLRTLWPEAEKQNQKELQSHISARPFINMAPNSAAVTE